MDIHKSTALYEAWLGRQVKLIRQDLHVKDERMRQGPHPFLRGTFYRWAQVFPHACEALCRAPRVLGVGDLHADNFGTWRDTEGRLVWGINDFDEVCRLPYTNDLVRLATSVVLAQEEKKLATSDHAAAETILAGYAAALQAGGRPIVLAEHQGALWEMAVHRLHEPEAWWKKLTGFRPVRTVPRSAHKALIKALPGPRLKHRVVHRIAGVGSLGRERYVAIADWQGGQVAREAKALAPSAWSFAHPEVRVKPKPLYKECLAHAVRSPDPYLAIKRRWVIRRLAPDCSRIDLTQLPEKRDEERLLYAMGWETANIHLGSANRRTLLGDLVRRPAKWLAQAAEQMADVVRRDWKEWK